MRHPTQGPHRGDDTCASWPVSIKRNLMDLAGRWAPHLALFGQAHEKLCAVPLTRRKIRIPSNLFPVYVMGDQVCASTARFIAQYDESRDW